MSRKPVIKNSKMPRTPTTTGRANLIVLLRSLVPPNVNKPSDVTYDSVTISQVSK